MSKKWKIKFADWFLRRYVAKRGRFQDKATFDPGMQFANIVIYSTTALGDFMFNTPAIRAVRERYPDAHITLVVHKKNQELVENGRYFNRVVYWDSKFKSMGPLLKSLRQFEPDLALILHSHQPYDVISAVLAGAKYIIRDNYRNGICGLEPWLTNYVFDYYGHFIRRKLELISILGCRTDDPSMEVPAPFPAGEKDPALCTIGFQLGASTESRCWPVSHFASLADQLAAQHDNVRIVLIGAPFDEGKAQQFLQLVQDRTRERVDNRIGKTGLRQLLTLLGSFELLVTGDTGPLHLAVALKVKTVSLFVTADPRTTGPIQDLELHRIVHASRSGYTLPLEAEGPMGVIQPQRVYHEVVAHANLLPAYREAGGDNA
ncbi:glycosyltransferase family 9 protein [Serratia odorifera]|uniref:Heptosyltransferase n=2 Tax=Serratia odorifera TaxID=618 RepID=D4DZA2_SEROD|nr:glycosyltransferase family 9 protein [Serratia odorifera]EFE97160.1 Heptosyltransferase [Serratia odorifera DSM 4582]PNK91623.1 glycosyltransferase family 9 protein [Serratia odorifera]RII72792.1 glycosyltransferase family 9 protein [Serratia odorifera]VDZ55053.1 ADP-heptose--LPS heptosyltransferase 2 [Serratia odorifera]